MIEFYIVTDHRHCAEVQDCSLEGSKTASALPSYISYILLLVSVACTHRHLFYVYITPDFHRFTIKSLIQFSHTAKLTYIDIHVVLIPVFGHRPYPLSAVSRDDGSRNIHGVCYRRVVWFKQSFQE